MQKQKNSIILLIFILVLVFILFIILYQAPKEIEIEKDSSVIDNVGIELDQDLKEDEFKDEPVKIEDILDNEEIEIEKEQGLDPIIISDNIELPEYPDNINQLINSVRDEDTLVTFLNNYFTFTETNTNIAKSPEETINDRSANALDLAVLAANVLHPHKQVVNVIAIEHENSDYHHAVVVFRGHDTPKYLTLTENNEVLMYYHGLSFSELMKAEAIRLDTKITRYFYSIPGNYDLTGPKSPFSWQIYNQ